MTHRQSWQRFLLIWLGGLAWIIGYMLVIWFDGSPNWLDVLVWGSWAVFASRWMDPFAQKLAQRRWIAPVMAVLLCTALAWSIPYMFHIPTGYGLWGMYQNGGFFLNSGPLNLQNVWQTFLYAPMALSYHIAFLRTSFGTGSITTPLVIGTAILLLVLGLGLTLLALDWRITWRTLSGLPIFSHVWCKLATCFSHLTFHISRFTKPISRLTHTRAWMWFRHASIAIVAFILLADVVGVVLTAFPVRAEWEPVLTTGFPPGPPQSVR
ncbi:MAG: hypothetical protein RBT75_17855, partial [Anaerolineae bacterium]|nr:hypothetical protein [Anaerolineae bacterium]